MTRLTLVFLVLLRLAIGWHFLFEGTEKYRTGSWSSEAYLRESSGPFAPGFRSLAGDSLADKLTLPKDSESKPPAERMPPLLDREWQAWFDAFLKNYGLPREPSDVVKNKLDDLRDEIKGVVRRWQEIDANADSIARQLREVQESREKADLEVRKAEADLEQFEKELQAVTAQLEKLDSGVDPQQKKELTNKKEYYERRVQEAKTQRDKWKKPLDAADAIRKELEKKQKDLSPEREKVEEELTKLQADERKLVQRGLAELRLNRRKEQTVRWLDTSKKPMPKGSSVGPTVTVEMTIPERIKMYRDLEEQARTIEARELRKAGDEKTRKEVSDRILAAKNEARRVRNELQAELARQTKEMQESVREVLTPEQLQTSKPMPDTVRPGIFQRGRLGVIDFLVPLGLVIVGGCLLLGLLTRTACVVGAFLLFSFYLAMPPLPGAMENLRAEGHYLIINKNIVEMFALLVLATLPTGRWAGLDGLLQYVGRRKPAPAPATSTKPGELTLPSRESRQ